ncbi:hypothetical protein [uncultured Winogradskyella sp.]|uniref:hypothetical protein n=1 Tax=uncultured Winogradskyella sp. TaxID=395353 RepID=UPI0030DA28E6
MNIKNYINGNFHDPMPKLGNYYCIIFFLILCSSCKNSEKEILINEVEEEVIETPVITNEFKIEFLNDILKDTLILSAKYVNAIIFEKKITNDKRIVNAKGKVESISDIQLIAITLSEKDTSFVYNQTLNKEFNIEKLKPLGYNVIDWKNIREDIYVGDSLVEERVFVSTDSLENIYHYLEKNSSISISKPIFNKSLNKAYIEVDFSYYYGYNYLFERTNNTWKFIDYAGQWIR